MTAIKYFIHGAREQRKDSGGGMEEGGRKVESEGVRALMFLLV